MALRSWTDRQNGVDYYNADDINSVAHAVVEIEERCDDFENRIIALEAGICLKRGTQILMANGSTKNIEDVEYGDMVKSWDVENGEYVDVKSYGALRMKLRHRWRTIAFGNGEALEVDDRHTIYNKTRGFLQTSAEWDIGNEAIGLDGVPTEFVWQQKNSDVEIQPSYALFTENSLYFANGILCGQHPHSLLRYHSLGILSKSITEEEIAMFRQIGDIYCDTMPIRNAEYLREVAPILKKRSECMKKRDDAKKKLADGDYKTIKRQQGKLSDEEWEEHIAESENLRKVFNENVKKNRQYLAEQKEIKKKYGLPAESKKFEDCFREAYDLQMQRIRGRK